jgi:hypothetical protein
VEGSEGVWITVRGNGGVIDRGAVRREVVQRVKVGWVGIIGLFKVRRGRHQENSLNGERWPRSSTAVWFG